MKQRNKLITAIIILVVGGLYIAVNNSKNISISDISIKNIEALSRGENDSSCSGCSAIGWGWSKILECDCNYDHFSTCDRWGC